MAYTKSLIIFYTSIIVSFFIDELIIYLLSLKRQSNVQSNGLYRSIENLFILLVFVTIPFILRPYNNLFINFRSILFVILTPIIWTMITFVYFPNEGSQLNTMKYWTKEEKIINSIFLCIIGIIIIAHFILAFRKNKKTFNYFIYSFTILFSVCTLLYIVSYYKKPIGENLFHPHHWFLAWIFSFYTIFPNNVWSQVGSGIAFGAMVHSFSNYDDNLIFFDK